MSTANNNKVYLFHGAKKVLFIGWE